MIYFLGNIFDIKKLTESIIGINSDNRRNVTKSVSLYFYIKNKKASFCHDLPNVYLGGWSWNHCCSI
jgi:hypothetical protein